MIAVVYVSSAVELFTTAQLLALLEESRRNNVRDGITGLLLYRGGNFMQLLEGEEDVVRRTHARILNDTRHRQVMTLLQEPIDARAFADWSMAFGNLDDPEVATHPGVSDFLDRPFTDPSFTGNAHRCLTLLRTFRRAMR